MKQKKNNYLDLIDHFIWLNGNYHSDGIASIGCLHSICITEAEGAFEQLRNFIQTHQNCYIFGYLSYDLKNDIEKLTQPKIDKLGFPELQFIVPETVIKTPKTPKTTNTYQKPILIKGKQEHLELFEKLVLEQDLIKFDTIKGKLNPQLQQKRYIENVEQIKKHLQLGDIYEMNYCYEFQLSEVEIDPFLVYHQLNSQSRASFSAFAKFKHHYLLSASPERFFKKEGDKIISQPIKGTVKRGLTLAEDEQLKNQLKQDKKERRENIMIVDLVRNDLSKVAKKGTVKVDELCEIYTFDTLHQMISTVSCELDNHCDLVDVFKALFPMGSMTGAPKIRAMEIIDEFETTKRSVYSGSLGYISPNGDADFNVIIRTFLYNSENQELSYSVGSAITHASQPEYEFEETLLKAQLAMSLFTNEKEGNAT